VGNFNEFLGLGLNMPEHVPQQLTALATHLANVNWLCARHRRLVAAIIYLWPD